MEPEVNVRAECELGIEDLDDNDKWMLDKNVEHLLSCPGCEQHNWLEDVRMARTEHVEDNPDEAPGLATLGGNRLAETTQVEHKPGNGELDNKDKWLPEEDAECWLTLLSPKQATHLSLLNLLKTTWQQMARECQLRVRNNAASRQLGIHCILGTVVDQA